MSLSAQKKVCCPLSDDSVWTQETFYRDVTIGAIMLSETLLGALGNLPLLCHYLLLNCSEVQVRPIDMIVLHLTMSNSLVILSKGVLHTTKTLGLKHVFSDLGCQLLSYVGRVGRGLSIGITCLLSVFQAIMISPMDSCWKDVKVKASQYVVSFVSLCWMFYLFIHLIFPLHILDVSSKWIMENITRKREWGYCYVNYSEEVNGHLYLALIVFPEISFSVLIIWASASMILFLYKHGHRVQYIHKNLVSSRSSAESRATQRILVLVSTFVCFYTLSSLFNMYLVLFQNDQNGLLFNTAGIFSLCFPTLSPFLVMRCDCTIFRFSFALIIKRRAYDYN